MENKKEYFLRVKKFLFPLYPIKIFKSTNTMLMVAVLLAMRIIFEALSINIPGVVLSLSFNWLPLMLMGWYFGPMYGLLLGAISDTLCYFIFAGGGTIWYWMYAIQEPIVGFIAGIMSAITKLRINNEKSNIIIDILIQQIIYIVFGSTCYIILILWLNPSHAQGVDKTYYETYKWLALALISAFFIVMEIFTFYYVIYHKEHKFGLINFIYVTCMVVIVMLIFSLALGPIVTVSYLTYVNGHVPENWVNIGASYYLIPRVIIDSIKVPVEASIISFVVINLDPMLKNMLANLNNRWK